MYSPIRALPLTGRNSAVPLWLPHLLQAGSLIVLCIFAALLALPCSGALRRQRDRMPTMQYAPQDAYRRYLRTRTGLNVTLTFLAGLAPFFVALIALGFDIALDPNADGLPDAGLAQVGYALLWGFALSLTLAPLVFNIISARLADAQAMRELLGLTTQPGELIGLRVKAALLYVLPLILIIEMFLGFSFFAQYGLPGTIVGLLALVVLALCVGIVTNNQMRLFFSSVPIEQTQWSEFGARARDWARLANVPLQGVRVLQLNAFGAADGAIRGFGVRTIYVSDVFLQMSEWRQQDAFTAYLLGYTKRHRIQAPWTYGFNALRLIFFAAVFILPVLIPGVEFSSEGPIYLVFPLGILLVLIISSIGMRWRSNILFTSDAFAAQLTGDPTAVMAMIATIDSRGPNFNRTPVFRGVVSPLLRYGGYRYYGFYGLGSVTRLPTILNRLAALDALMRAPGPRAPWALAPVPSIMPVAMGPYPVTVPLHMAPRTTPGLVPTALYPTNGAPFAPVAPYAPAPQAPYAPLGYAQVPQPPYPPYPSQPR